MAVHPVIMCGGSGTRLWPASSPTRPKQFIPLTGDRSTFQDTIARVEPLARDGGSLVIVAGIAHEQQIRAQMQELGLSAQLLLEPEPRDSGPAMAAAAAWIQRRDPTGVAVFVSADHHVPKPEAFRAAVAEALPAAQEGRLVLLGVRPTFAATAFGYIQPSALGEGVSAVAKFVEKPDQPTAETYVAQGFLWNSGNFVVRADILLSELDRYEPEVSQKVRAAVETSRIDGDSAVIGPLFSQAPKISIDYAVVEKTQLASVVPVSFDWSDLGAWDAVWAASEQDAAGNASIGESLLLDSEGCLIRAAPGASVSVIGGHNLAVVVDKGAVLVCDLSQAQKVKKVAEHWAGRAAPGGFSSLDEARSWYRRWLQTSALPLWWTLGADHERGGFFEALDETGAPVRGARRARVQTRQAFCYLAAGRMGWTGPWRQAASHGLDYFLARYRRPDGLFCRSVGDDGEVIDGDARIYDQAFALLAFATAHSMGVSAGDLEGEARSLRSALDRLRHPAGGFRENGDEPFQANALMHLLEATMAWVEAKGDPEWAKLAHELVALALRSLIDPKDGAIREIFDADWNPLSAAAGQRLEPGHQFEWAWLLTQYGRLFGDSATAPVAQRLYEAGVRGIDARRKVALNALNPEGGVLDDAARLWPQTEFLRAALVFDADGAKGHALQAAGALARYLETPIKGAWTDLMLPSGAMVRQPAPASSFYHIVGACSQLLGD
ncbi:AGE family epimerase/isomerase [Phenylobacterium sp. LjRoot225]|uniref:AGE family epimerase/isomerase n=1 Tax=Phenylobacterium sp. LjRoot225 TaxID=3342285 RepID=UPI003ECC1EFF